MPVGPRVRRPCGLILDVQSFSVESRHLFSGLEIAGTTAIGSERRKRGRGGGAGGRGGGEGVAQMCDFLVLEREQDVNNRTQDTVAAQLG